MCSGLRHIDFECLRMLSSSAASSVTVTRKNTVTLNSMSQLAPLATVSSLSCKVQPTTGSDWRTSAVCADYVSTLSTRHCRVDFLIAFDGLHFEEYSNWGSHGLHWHWVIFFLGLCQTTQCLNQLKVFILFSILISILFLILFLKLFSVIVSNRMVFFRKRFVWPG